MASIQELLPLISEPKEELSVEYKDWLDLTKKEDKAKLAKAAIALANHGGGFVVLGFAEEGPELQSQARPQSIPVITQDSVNDAIRRYATPEFHCRMDKAKHPNTNEEHPIIVVPSDLTVPVMSKRGCPGVIEQHRCYVRKPGPRSEEPQTSEEWRNLLNRCIQAGRENMLEAIRAILSGRVEPQNPETKALGELQTYCIQARERWEELVASQPEKSPARFPHGYYEMGFSLVGAQPANGPAEVRDRLTIARRIKLTVGWSAFLEMFTEGWAPYAHEKKFVEAWIGRPVRTDSMKREPAHCDFWRASMDGNLYTIRGYKEDGLAQIQAGTIFDGNLPVRRIAEGLLFANRFGETFDGVEEIAIQCRFTALNGRCLTGFDDFEDYISRTNEVTLTGRATPLQVQDNLAEILHPLLLPLYEHFKFFKLPFNLVKEQLAYLRHRF